MHITFLRVVCVYKDKDHRLLSPWMNCTYHASITFTVAVCTLFMNIIDNAIYPHLCADYVIQVLFSTVLPTLLCIPVS